MPYVPFAYNGTTKGGYEVWASYWIEPDLFPIPYILHYQKGQWWDEFWWPTFKKRDAKYSGRQSNSYRTYLEEQELEGKFTRDLREHFKFDPEFNDGIDTYTEMIRIINRVSKEEEARKKRLVLSLQEIRSIVFDRAK